MLIIRKKDRVELKRFNIGFKKPIIASKKPRYRRMSLIPKKPPRITAPKIRVNLKYIFYPIAAISLVAVFTFFISKIEFSSLFSKENVQEIADNSSDNSAENGSEMGMEDDEDEKLKNEIMASDKTDYTEEDKNAPLRISIHKVQPGETLSEIAKKHGVSMDTICGSSSLTSYDLIRTGQILRIPNKDGILYTMKKDQNLVDIASKYKVSIDKIIANNDLINPDYIQPGIDIFVPDAKPQNIVPGFLWPIASRRLSSSFGWRYHPIYKKRIFHKGIDIKASYQWVKSTRYGKVTFAGWLGGYGNAVIISHPGGWKSLYGHLSKIIVKPGQYVRQGQIVAKSGNTGVSTGPHLHFEIHKNGAVLNPRKYVH